MDIVVEKHQIGSVGEQADQQTTDVVLVVPDRLCGGAEDAVELEQYGDQNERAGRDREANIAKTPRQTRAVSSPGSVVICEIGLKFRFFRLKVCLTVS